MVTHAFGRYRRYEPMNYIEQSRGGPSDRLAALCGRLVDGVVDGALRAHAFAASCGRLSSGAH
jgi:hypothetical protein